MKALTKMGYIWMGMWGGLLHGSGLSEAMGALAGGAEDAPVVVDVLIVERLDADDYIGEVNGIRLLVDAGTVSGLTVGQTVRLRGELEPVRGNPYGTEARYELDVWAIEGDDSVGDGTGNGGEPDAEDLLTSLADGIAYLEANPLAEEIRVRVTGTVGAKVDLDPRDDDYRFADGSGVTVVLDLDKRAKVDFLLSAGTLITVEGELERSGEWRDLGIGFELDAYTISLGEERTYDLNSPTALDGWILSDWIGSMAAAADGWKRHAAKGYIFTPEPPVEEAWFFASRKKDWFWSHKSIYPFVWGLNEGWLYLLGDPSGGTQHAFSYNGQAWLMDYWSMER